MQALLRTFLATFVLAGVVLLGFWRLSINQSQRALDEMRALNQQMQQRLHEREQMIERLSTTRRLAHIDVTGQERDEHGNVLTTDLTFIELDEQETELARQQFTIPGEMLFVDAWTVKFNHADVAAGDPLTGRTLVLLRRVYSDQMPPRDGFPIDTPGAIPPAYATGDVGQFERRVWDHFWSIATDPRLALEMGVRVAQGEAVYKPVKVGQQLELIVDAAGGNSLTVIDQDAQKLTAVHAPK